MSERMAAHLPCHPTERHKICMFDYAYSIHLWELIDLIEAGQRNGLIVLCLKLQPAIDIGIGQP